jgi:phosphatidylserine/phosphatidylglycerophosphate/cardiolipin synthase-like enzyme
MEPVIFAIAIVVTIAFAYFAGKKLFFSESAARGAGAFAAIGWIVWTLLVFFSLSAAMVQITVVLLAFGAVVFLGQRFSKKDKSLAEKEREIAHLRNALEGLSPTVVDTVINESVSIDTVRGIAEHKRLLANALVDARSDLFIASGWARPNVVDRSFLRKLEKRVKNGLNCVFVYGWEDDPAKRTADERNVDKKLHKLRNWSDSKRLGQVILANPVGGTHIKALIVDDRYCVVGSFNFLSNAFGQRDELSIRVNDPSSVMMIRQELRELAKHFEGQNTEASSSTNTDLAIRTPSKALSGIKAGLNQVPVKRASKKVMKWFRKKTRLD